MRLPVRTCKHSAVDFHVFIVFFILCHLPFRFFKVVEIVRRLFFAGCCCCCWYRCCCCCCRIIVESTLHLRHLSVIVTLWLDRNAKRGEKVGGCPRFPLCSQLCLLRSWSTGTTFQLVCSRWYKDELAAGSIETVIIDAVIDFHATHERLATSGGSLLTEGTLYSIFVLVFLYSYTAADRGGQIRHTG